MGEFPVETTGITEAAQETIADPVQELDAITPALEQPEETQDAEVFTFKSKYFFNFLFKGGINNSTIRKHHRNGYYYH